MITILKRIFPSHFESVDSVFFFGGEPLLNMPCIEAVDNFFVDLVENSQIIEKPRYTLVTNGTLITESIAEYLARIQVQITVSIDGPEIINDVNRIDNSGKGSFNRIEHGIQLLQKYGASLVALEATYTKKHIEMGLSRSDIVDFLHSKFGPLNILIEDCGGRNIDLMLPLQDRKINQISQADYAYVLNKLKSQKRHVYACDVMEGSFMIAPDGLFYPCHMFYPDSNYAFKNNSSYKEVRNKISKANRENKKSCAQCWSRNFCRNCPASILLFTDDNQQEEEVCNIIRHRTERILHMICEDNENNELKNFNLLNEV